MPEEVNKTKGQLYNMSWNHGALSVNLLTQNIHALYWLQCNLIYRLYKVISPTGVDGGLIVLELEVYSEQCLKQN